MEDFEPLVEEEKELVVWLGLWAVLVGIRGLDMS